MIETVETNQLVLRPMTLDDVDLLVELDRDPEVMRYPSGRAATREEVEASIRDRLGCRWIATEKTSSAFFGWFGLVPGDDHSYYVSYRLRRERWGEGLATEGTQALIEGAFTIVGARRVIAQTMAVNTRSRAVMERCGMRHTRTFPLELDRPLPGKEEGGVEYEITRDDWDRARGAADEA